MRVVQARAFEDELEKIAILGHLAMGPIGHFATNILGHAAHHSSNLGEHLSHLGLQHGLTGSQIHPMAQRSIRSLAGPEALANYDVAHSFAKSIQHLPTHEQHAIMAQAMEHTRHQALQDAPIAGTLRQAMGHELAGTAPTLQSHGLRAGVYAKSVGAMSKLTETPFDTSAQRIAKGVVGAAPLAAAGALDPIGMSAHVGVNAAREVAGNSNVGQRAMKEMFQQGLNGRTVHPYLERAIDYGISPAVLDPLRVGQAVGRAAPEATARFNEVTTNPEMMQHVHSMRQAIQNPAGYTQHLRSYADRVMPPVNSTQGVALG